MTQAEDTRNMTLGEKVVVQYGDRQIKGYLESPAWNTIEELLSNAPRSLPETWRIRLVESGCVEELPIKDVKAIFYVNSFEGDPGHDDLNFHKMVPVINGVWIRIKFSDGEILEGIVYNSIRYLVDPGFFLVPTDPDSNNRLVYVVKSRIADYQVLGLRRL
jgi:hypothetical protein